MQLGGSSASTKSPVASAGGTRDEDVTNEDVLRLNLATVVGYSGELTHGQYPMNACCMKL